MGHTGLQRHRYPMGRLCSRHRLRCWVWQSLASLQRRGYSSLAAYPDSDRIHPPRDQRDRVADGRVLVDLDPLGDAAETPGALRRNHSRRAHHQ